MTAALTSRAEATRRALIDAAVAEWTVTGEVEVAAVARRAGVSAGLPYRYFGTRSGLLIALVEDFYSRLEDAAGMRRYDASSWIDRERRRIEGLGGVPIRRATGAARLERTRRRRRGYRRKCPSRRAVGRGGRPQHGQRAADRRTARRPGP